VVDVGWGNPIWGKGNRSTALATGPVTSSRRGETSVVYINLFDMIYLCNRRCEWTI
jgi:hypothetical protein